MSVRAPSMKTALPMKMSFVPPATGLRMMRTWSPTSPSAPVTAMIRPVILLSRSNAPNGASVAVDENVFNVTASPGCYRRP